MRLTKDHRSRIYRKVRESLPANEEKAKAHKILQADALRAWPAILAIVQANARDEFFQRYYYGVHGQSFYIVRPNDYKISPKVEKELQPICERMAAHQNMCQAAKDEATKALASCTTMKKLLSTYPAMKKFVPKDLMDEYLSPKDKPLAVPASLPALHEAGLIDEK